MKNIKIFDIFLLLLLDHKEKLVNEIEQYNIYQLKYG